MDSLTKHLADGRFSLSAIVSAIFGAWVVYWAGLGIYRLYLSPLAAFPGPKLAALTVAYQAYYDIWLGGQFFKQIDELHKKFGPIVRINPHEIHINDPFFIEELYAGSNKKRDKFKWAGRQVLLPESLVATMPSDLHRKRRAVLNPFFSKASIRKLDPVVQKSLDAIFRRLDTCAESSELWPASLAYKAATCDTITEFCFGVSTDYIDRDDYETSYFKAVDDHLQMSWKMTYIPWFGPMMEKIPPVIGGILWPGLKLLWEMHSRWSAQIEEIRGQGKEGSGTVFHGLLNNDLPASEKSNGHLRQTAQLLVLAGQDTTAYTLSALTYRLLANPEMFKKLKTELENAIPDPDTPVNSAQLEQLPYLTGLIQEGVRLHPGALVRQARIAPDEDLIYTDPESKRQWIIPAGTSVAMDARSCNLHPRAFSAPHRFLPERWIENPRLDRYLLSFSRGTRICLGLNLAYSEMYMILGGIFRRFDLYDGTGKQTQPTLSLEDTEYTRDIEVQSDFLVPFPSKGSKGVQVKVRAASQA